MNENSGAGIVLAGGLMIVAGTIAGLMWGIPTYNVWTSSLSGKADDLHP
jgi:hypothetical protein